MTDQMQSQLLEAINALYHNTDPKVKSQASEWLSNWQQTFEAWPISDRVLHNAESTFEAQFYCAQTLRTKVRSKPLNRNYSIKTCKLV